MKVLLGVLAITASATVAFAFNTEKLGQGGSLSLTDIALIDKTPKLKAEVDAAVAKTGKTAEEIICTGMRFPGSWTTLGGERVAPYTCDIGEQTLEIRARVRVTDRKGRPIESINATAMKRAHKVSEDRPTWSWARATPTRN